MQGRIWLTGMFLLLCGGSTAFAVAQKVDSGVQVPRQGHLRVGAFQRTLELDIYEYDNRSLSPEHELDGKGLSLQYGVTDYFFVSGRVGTMSWKMGRDGTFDAGRAWGIGLGGAVPVYDAMEGHLTLDLGWDFAYDAASPDDMLVRRNRLIFGSEVECWQASLAAYVGLYRFFGFAGLRYSQVDLTYTHDSSRGLRRGGFEEDQPFGGFVGGGVNVYKGLILRAETQVFDMTGYEVSIAYDFNVWGDR